MLIKCWCWFALPLEVDIRVKILSNNTAKDLNLQKSEEGPIYRDASFLENKNFHLFDFCMFSRWFHFWLNKQKDFFSILFTFTILSVCNVCLSVRLSVCPSVSLFVCLCGSCVVVVSAPGLWENGILSGQHFFTFI